MISMMQCVRAAPQKRPKKLQPVLSWISWKNMAPASPMVKVMIHFTGASVFGNAMAFSAASEGRMLYSFLFRRNRRTAMAKAKRARRSTEGSAILIVRLEGEEY